MIQIKVRDIYKERAALERDFAAKLQVLARKAAEKKSKIECKFVLGSDPTKAWDESTLKQSTLNTAYDDMINSMFNTAQDHLNVADVLTTQVIDVLKAVERKNDETQKKEMQFFQKITSERDRIYNDRTKGRAQDDRHADRVARQAEQQRNEMLNSKNVYIISTAVANGTKSKYYSVDIPSLENRLQVLQARLVERFTKILLHAQALQLSHLDVLKGRLAGLESTLGQVDPPRDQDLFIEYNIRPFSAPADWSFEPCHNFYDNPRRIHASIIKDELNVETTPKVFLQNRLRRCQAKLKELTPVIETKEREHQQLDKLVAAYTADRSLGNIDDITNNYLDVEHQLTLFKSSECILQAEIDTIVSAVGDDVGAQQPHSFKSSSFSIPTTCGYCKTSIWGLSKQGKTCKVCNLSVHSKCELKVPADCQQGGDMQRSASTISTVSRHTSRLSTQAPTRDEAPTPSSFVQSSSDKEPESYPKAKVIYDFVATSEFELSVSGKYGATVNVLEADDGSGWVKVADSRGANGLVPASYLEYQDEMDPSTTSSSTPLGSGRYGKYQSGSVDITLIRSFLFHIQSRQSIITLLVALMSLDFKKVN
ncbi:Protein BZZ1 [Paramarasmius palmivorus]|uniref:Protein BZZ1 n=1 Tax=Paramarasmius palmivorus TaxID=297713 RepID=A0AAW0E083_9AGAR